MLARRRTPSLPHGLAALAVALLLTLPVLADSPSSYLVAADEDGPSVYWFGDVSRAYLGIQLEEEIDDPEGGARVTEVVEGSPAERAEIEVGDIIVGATRDTVVLVAGTSHQA